MTLSERFLLSLIAATLVSACSAPKYRCSAVDGVGCTPVDDVHALAVNGELPDKKPADLNNKRNDAHKRHQATDYRSDSYKKGAAADKPKPSSGCGKSECKTKGSSANVD